MAGNFWQSSHYLQWILDKQDLLKERQKDLKFLTEEEYWKLQIFFTNVIWPDFGQRSEVTFPEPLEDLMSVLEWYL